MRKLATVIAAVLGLGFLYNQAYPSTRIFYRLTLDVATPEGPKSGSGVLMASIHSEPAIFGSRGGSLGLNGEAVAVDLGQRGVLFALLTGRNDRGEPGGTSPPQVLLKLFGMLDVPEDTRAQKISRMTGATAELPLNDIPFQRSQDSRSRRSRELGRKFRRRRTLTARHDRDHAEGHLAAERVRSHRHADDDRD